MTVYLPLSDLNGGGMAELVDALGDERFYSSQVSFSYMSGSTELHVAIHIELTDEEQVAVKLRFNNVVIHA